MCTFALAIISSMSFCSFLCLLRACSTLYGVHIGLPIRIIGFCVSTMAMASFLFSSRSKSQGSPLSLALVMSNAKPATRPMSGSNLMACVTRAGL